MGYPRVLLVLFATASVSIPALARSAQRLQGAKEQCREEANRCLGEVETSCDPGCGRGADRCLSRRRERVSEDGQWIFRNYSFERFFGLNRFSSPASKRRIELDESLVKKINQIETHSGAALEGYLLGVRRIKRLPGTCAKKGKREEGVELWVGKSPTADKSAAVRAQLTAAVLEQHPRWSRERLKPWRTHGEEDAPRIRVRGYLLYNNLRAAEVAAGLRPTAWEITPVTEILFCPSTWECGRSDEDGWLELDTL